MDPERARKVGVFQVRRVSLSDMASPGAVSQGMGDQNRNLEGKSWD